MQIDTKAQKTWERANHAYKHYICYIESKPDPISLSFTDLIFVKNFKGGMATICEPVATLSTKLQCYAESLRKFRADSAFCQPLAKLSDAEYMHVRDEIIRFVQPPKKLDKIDGIRASFASALLHFYFPAVVPILDRRVLNGAGIQGIRVNNQDEVVNSLELYPKLIDFFRSSLRSNPEKSLRELDRELFIQKLQSPPFRRR